MPYKKLHIDINYGVGYILLSSGSRFNKLTIHSSALALAKRAVNAAEDLDLKNGRALEASSYAVLCATSLKLRKMETILEGT